MEITFRTSKKDYLNYCKSQLEQNLREKLPLVVVFFILWIIVSSVNFSWTKLGVTLIAGILFIAILFYYFPLFVHIKRLNKLIASDPGYTEERKWTIQDDGLLSEGVSSTSLRKWEAFSEAKTTQHYISFILKDKRFLMIPKSCFATDTDALNFYGLAEAKIAKVRGVPSLITSEYKKKAPPYMLGFLGLIPLIGAFVGVGLILYGIIKYKDKKLIAIGVAGIAFTIIVYGSLFYYSKNNDVFKKGFIELNKGNLNSIVKEIEFYKLKNGQYPSDLDQLNDKNHLISFVDLVSENPAKKFNYRLIGKKYTLFSSGVDQTPYTKDDIYPTLEIDTTKMGLIINNR